MKLEKQLKADAATLLDALLVELKSSASCIAKRGGLTADTLCRLAVGGRVESIRKAAISKMSYKMGEALYKQYNAQSEAKK